MILKLQKVETGFEVLDRNTIQNIQNSTALAIWVYLQSKPENWNVNEKEIILHFDFGRDRYLKAMRYLKELGLYEYIDTRGKDGRISGNIFRLYPQVRKSVLMENRNLGKTDPIKNTDNIKNTEYRGHPTEKQVIEAAKKLHISEDTAVKFYLHYESTGWRGINDFVPRLRKWELDNNTRHKEEKVQLWG